MKRLFLALTGTVALTQVALAADLPSKAPPLAPSPPPVFSWTGFYVGLNGGYGWQSQTDPVEMLTNDITPVNLGDAIAASRGTIGDLRAQGGFAGGQLGYNYQFAPYLLVGIETDFQGSSIKDSVGPAGFTNPNGTFPIVGSADVRLSWFGTVRGRIGFTASNWLFYGTGGFAYGNVDYRITANEVGPGLLFQTSMSSNSTSTGWVAGGGVEYGITRNVTVKAEYQYLDFGTVSASSPVRFIANGAPTGETAFSNDIKAAFHTVRLGFNAKFWP